MIDWSRIDTVFLDMDGTLLDLEFDNVLWNSVLPRRYATRLGIDETVARERLFAHFETVRHTIDFYSLDYWAEHTAVDIFAMHDELKHLIRYRPHAQSFLERVRATGRRVWLVTNAHRGSLAVKDLMTGLTRAVDHTVSSHDFDTPKESTSFWRRLTALTPFTAARALLVDDNAAVLDCANEFGVGHLLTITQPDSSRPPREALRYPSFNTFDEIMPP